MNNEEMKKALQTVIEQLEKDQQRMKTQPHCDEFIDGFDKAVNTVRGIVNG